MSSKHLARGTLAGLGWLARNHLQREQAAVDIHPETVLIASGYGYYQDCTDGQPIPKASRVWLLWNQASVSAQYVQTFIYAQTFDEQIRWLEIYGSLPLPRGEKRRFWDIVWSLHGETNRHLIFLNTKEWSAGANPVLKHTDFAKAIHGATDQPFLRKQSPAYWLAVQETFNVLQQCHQDHSADQCETCRLMERLRDRGIVSAIEAAMVSQIA